MAGKWLTCGDGTRLRVEEHGDPNAAVTVVLVHCYALDRREWEPVVAALPRDVRVVTYDHRGYGESDPADPDTSTLAQLASDLECVLTQRAPHGPVVLVGHSMGGMAIMALAERRPELVRSRVSGVVFVATAVSDMGVLSLGLPGVVASVVHAAERVGVGVLSLLGCRRLFGAPALVEPFVKWLVFGAQARAEDVAAIARLVVDCAPTTLLTFRRTFDDHDCRDALAEFDGTRAVVLVGDRDRMTPPRHAATITEWLPGSRLVILPGAGHMLPHERTAEVVGAITDVVAAVEPVAVSA